MIDDFELLRMLEQTLADDDAYEEYLKEFKADLITETSKMFFELNKEYYPIQYQKFYEICLEKLDITAQLFCEDFGDLIEHYKTDTSDFLKFELLIVKPDKESPQDYIDQVHKLFIGDRQAEGEEIIEEYNQECAMEYDYYEKFTNTIKRFLSDYMLNEEHLTGRAYRELEYLCNYYYHEINDEMYSIASDMRKELEQNATNLSM